jgi:uncharacterized membrane protein YgaE (UPF0421/DUF939 family)
MNRILITAIVACLAFWASALWGLLYPARYVMSGF